MIPKGCPLKATLNCTVHSSPMCWCPFKVKLNLKKLFLGYTKLISRAQGPHVVPPIPCMTASVWSWCNWERGSELKMWLNVTGVSLSRRGHFHSILTGLVEGFSMSNSHPQVLGWQTKQNPGPLLRWFMLNSSPAAQGQPSSGWSSVFPLLEPSPLQWRWCSHSH